MKKGYLFIGLSALLAFGEACKKKDHADMLQAAFYFTDSSFREGDTLHPAYTSTHVHHVEWSTSANVRILSENPPLMQLTEAGEASITLKVFGEGGNAEQLTRLFTVLPDTVWRLSAKSRKVWRAVSLKYNGVEMLNEPCQKDDDVVFEFNRYRDYAYLDGRDTCDPGTYLVPVPQKGTWEYIPRRRELACSVVDPAPFLLSFHIDTLTNSYFRGTDPINGAVFILRVP
jgi:hypothetical protein